jgi:hypothetical protein
MMLKGPPQPPLPHQHPMKLRPKAIFLSNQSKINWILTL